LRGRIVKKQTKMKEKERIAGPEKERVKKKKKTSGTNDPENNSGNSKA